MQVQNFKSISSSFFNPSIDIDQNIEVILDLRVEHRCKIVQNFLCLIQKHTYQVIFLEVNAEILHDPSLRQILDAP